MNQAIQNILADTQEAIGGQTVLSQLDSLQALASCSGPTGLFHTMVYSTQDGRTCFEQIHANKRRTLAGISYEGGWHYNITENSYSEFSPTDIAFLQGHELHMLALAPLTRLGQPTQVETTTFNGRAAHILNYQDALEAPLLIYYDQENGLPLGIKVIANTGDDKSEVYVSFSDWQTFGNVRLFTRAHFRQGADIFYYIYTDIRLNNVSNDIFQPHEYSTIDTDILELMQRQKQQQDAHLTYNSALLASMLNEPSLEINQGQLTKRTRQESQNRFQAYFDQVNFLVWRDLSPPIIHVSGSGDMAYIIVHKLVHLTYENTQGKTIEESAEFMWLEVWEKQTDNWMLMTIASTNRPDSN